MAPQSGGGLMSPGLFRIANELLGDTSALQAQLEQDGYLFFRDALDRDQVNQVKQDMVRVLQVQGVVKPGESEPVWTGRGLEAIDDQPLYGLSSWQVLLESDRTRSFIEHLFGEPVFLYRNTDIRFALPNDAVHLTPPHQDHFFIRKTDRFRTVYIFRGRKQRGVPFDRVSHEWVSIDYRPGDLLMFHSLTIHCALPNGSPRIRLSLDARYQPEAEPRTWQSQQSILEMRRYRQEVKRLALEEGASEETFETLLIEMMKLGLEAHRGNVKTMVTASLTGQRQ
jgi:1-deoxypentalenic acid 11beta-hydroxylase